MAPPALAALASDVTIGCHMDASTAALEAALGGVKTILIDREGQPNSILAQKLSAGKVIYNNWEEALTATMNYFKKPSENSEFGDWSNCIDELDPYRDGLAAKRIGDFLQSLREGFNQGLQRDEVMQKAYENYAKSWGKEMIIKNIN